MVIQLWFYCKRGLLFLFLGISVLSTSGCSLSDVNDIRIPTMETQSEHSPFPPSVYEYNDDKGDNDAATVWNKIKSKTSQAWSSFTSGSWLDWLY